MRIRGATGRLPSKKDKYPHSGIITGDAHSSYKVNPNCALCQKTSFFFSVNFMLNRAILLPTFFVCSISGHLSIHFLIFFPTAAFTRDKDNDTVEGKVL